MGRGRKGGAHAALGEMFGEYGHVVQWRDAACIG